MGGMVLRAYLQNMATDGAPDNLTVYGYQESGENLPDDPIERAMRVEYEGLESYETNDDRLTYQGDVNKAIFIATPHRGFPFDYATWEGLTWEHYLDEDVEVESGGFLLKTSLDHLLWPYMITKRYKPTGDEPCSINDTEAILNLIKEQSSGMDGGAGVELLEILAKVALAGLCPAEVLYKYSHSNPFDPNHPGIGSLPEMLPDQVLAPAEPYLSSGTYPANFLLDDLGLNKAASLAKLEEAVGIGNLYVLYNDSRDTIVSYEVDPAPDPGVCLQQDTLLASRYIDFIDACIIADLIGPRYPNLQRWPYGLVENPRAEGKQTTSGDNLIPTNSTTLFRSGLTTLFSFGSEFDQLNQELNIPQEDDSTGHVNIVHKEATQDVVGAILTGLEKSSDVLREAENEADLFPIYSAYDGPTFGLSNLDVVINFLVHSPVDILIIDPQGRRIGYDPDTAQIINEIPGAYYTGNSSEVEFFLLPKEDEGDFTITATGTDTGLYAVSTHRVSENEVQILDIITGTTQPGQVDTIIMPLRDTQIVLEAEAFTSNINRNGQAWTQMSQMSGYIGSGYLKAGPDRDAMYGPEDRQVAPELQYTLQVTQTGLYHLWVRGSGANGAGDSIHVAMVKEGDPPTSTVTLSGFPLQQWGWSRNTLDGTMAQVMIDTPGSYSLFIWPREDGVRLDRLLLTNNTRFYYPRDADARLGEP